MSLNAYLQQVVYPPRKISCGLPPYKKEHSHCETEHTKHTSKQGKQTQAKTHRRLCTNDKPILDALIIERDNLLGILVRNGVVGACHERVEWCKCVCVCASVYGMHHRERQ